MATREFGVIFSGHRETIASPSRYLQFSLWGSRFSNLMSALGRS